MLLVVTKMVKCTECGEKIIRLVLNPASQPLKSDACPHSTQQPPTQERIFYCRLSPAIPSVRPFYDYIHTSNLLCEIKGKQLCLLRVLYPSHDFSFRILWRAIILALSNALRTGAFEKLTLGTQQ